MGLRKALATEQFELHYQPLVVLETNEVNTASFVRTRRSVSTFRLPPTKVGMTHAGSSPRSVRRS